MKNLLSILTILILSSSTVFAAGSSSDSQPKVSDYKKAVKLVKSAKKYESDGKNDKAEKKIQTSAKITFKIKW